MIKIFNLSSLKQLNTKNIFFIAIFFLASVPILSCVLILLTSIFSKKNKSKDFFKNKWNYPFLVSIFLMLGSCTNHFFINSEIYINEWNPIISLAGLANWVPFFFIFWAIEDFIKTATDRKKVILLALSGTIPVALSGLLQVFFGWYGPFELLNGFIIWYQNDMQGLSGPFNNSNYASLWLAAGFQFSLSTLINQKNNDFIKKIIVFSISILMVTALILTNSRSGILSIFYSTPILFAANIFIPLSIFLIPVMVFFLIVIINYFPLEIFNILPVTLQIWITEKLNIFSLNDIESYPRIFIWNKSIDFISQRPIFGFGGGSFPYLLGNQNSNLWYGHAHNLPIDIALSYGVPSSLIISSTVLVLLFLSAQKIFVNKSDIKVVDKVNKIFDKAWFASAIIVVFSHLVDVQYFDFRISILAWILLAGLKNIIATK